MIEFFYEETEQINVDLSSLKHWINNCVINEKMMMGSLSIIFCSDEYLLDINNKYLNHDYFTDIITFDYSEQNIISGDLFISIDGVKDNANELNIEFIEELNRVIIHGVLHLLGYKDKSEEEKKEMRERENFYLKRRRDVG